VKLKIGIFDSGIGGFTILNSLLKTRKDVEVFYLADTKRIPFGSKNFKEIRFIAKEICTFFEDKNLDALLIACNTTNACALDILKNNLRIPCFDLINSVSEIVNKQIIGAALETEVNYLPEDKALNDSLNWLKEFGNQDVDLFRDWLIVSNFQVVSDLEEKYLIIDNNALGKIQINKAQGLNVIDVGIIKKKLLLESKIQNYAKDVQILLIWIFLKSNFFDSKRKMSFDFLL